MEKNKIIIAVMFIIIISCNNKQNTKEMNSDLIIVKEEQCKDSIIYILPENTILSLEKMIKDKEIFFGSILENSDDNKYSFSFPYIDKFKIDSRTEEILAKTNTYLKVRDLFIPLIRNTDILFAKTGNDSLRFTNDFNYLIITVNRDGALIDGFAY